ncbi:hypothetical protein SPV1_12922 [Mariprofundus ferrooxydans PV-1]|uniref:Uncharacterized protein n=1 Tax=Mariprofundus ferrooxydans PV-1 TaxID=314345 RepID=Q0EW15_9PROT|nr:hypothetical protein SPV1_12922 [Mariprofundus ferrooxydans PV-1]
MYIRNSDFGRIIAIQLPGLAYLLPLRGWSSAGSVKISALPEGILAATMRVL